MCIIPAEIHGASVIDTLHSFRKDRYWYEQSYAHCNALDSIIQCTELKAGREIMEAYFLVYQLDRYAPNRSRARELLERIGASPKLLGERSYVSASYKVLLPLDV